MSDPQFDKAITFDDGIKIVNSNYVEKVISFLETGHLESSYKNYIKCYT